MNGTTNAYFGVFNNNIHYRYMHIHGDSDGKNSRGNSAGFSVDSFRFSLCPHLFLSFSLPSIFSLVLGRIGAL